MFIYNLVIFLYGWVIKTASVKKPKAKQWVEGRKAWRTRYRHQESKLGTAKRIWIHCASYGEFEQGRPLLEEIRLKYPEYKLILTFFSPSGYEAFKEWKGADMICYLPLDTKANARDFLDIIDPSISIFIKYEFWINFLNELKERKIRTFLVSAVFKPHHPFFKWYGGIFRRSLSAFELLDVQDENSFSLLKSIGLNNVRTSGDTRFDRVLQIKKNPKDLPLARKFATSKRVLIGGSTYRKDHELLLKVFSEMEDQELKLILVPHEVQAENILELCRAIKEKNISFARYTKGEQDLGDARILVIDTIGVLSQSYRYAHAAYIGGGFNDGWHNVLEPSVFGLPVAVFGKDEGKFNEITELIKLGTVTNIFNESDLKDFIKRSSDEGYLKNTASHLEKYFEQNSNVTTKILQYLKL